MDVKCPGLLVVFLPSCRFLPRVGNFWRIACRNWSFSTRENFLLHLAVCLSLFTIFPLLIPPTQTQTFKRFLFALGCYKITTVFSHAQTVVCCVGCSQVLCQPSGGKARLTEGTKILFQTFSPINQSINQSTALTQFSPINQSINRLHWRNFHQSINQSIDRLTVWHADPLLFFVGCSFRKKSQ